MDVQAIDQNYQQLENQSQQTIQALSSLSKKLQDSVQSGDQKAREWQLDLREIAMQIQQEQNQVTSLLQAIHTFVANQAQQPAVQQPQPTYQQPTYQPQQPMYPQQQPGYQQPMYQQPGYQQPGYAQEPYAAPQQYYQQQGGGGFSRFLNSGFGRAIAQGAGFGIGDDLINDLFN
jgi:hypothetical protein